MAARLTPIPGLTCCCLFVPLLTHPPTSFADLSALEGHGSANYAGRKVLAFPEVHWIAPVVTSANCVFVHWHRAVSIELEMHGRLLRCKRGLVKERSTSGMVLTEISLPACHNSVKVKIKHKNYLPRKDEGVIKPSQSCSCFRQSQPGASGSSCKAHKWWLSSVIGSRWYSEIFWHWTQELQTCRGKFGLRVFYLQPNAWPVYSEENLIEFTGTYTQVTVNRMEAFKSHLRPW